MLMRQQPTSLVALKFQEGKAGEGDKREGKPSSKENKCLVIQNVRRNPKRSTKTQGKS